MKLSLNNSIFLKVILFCSIGSCFAGSPVFIENKGQIMNQNQELNSDVLFMYTGNGIKIQLRKNGYSYEFFSVNNLPDIHPEKKIKTPQELLKTFVSSHRIDIDFLSPNTDPEIVTDQKHSTVNNYCINGNEVNKVNSFSKVTYKNIFEKVDIEFVLIAHEPNPFKYNIILHPGANINDVKFLCKGASAIKKNPEGALCFVTTLGSLEENIPFSYYENSRDKNIEMKFNLNNNIISFSGDYDHSKTFVIDPSTNRVWGTYFGGSSLEYCTSNGVDASNNVYIAGYSLSTANIATSGVYQSTITGSFDAYLSKFNSNGVQLWGTYFGGPSFDIFYAMHVMPNGMVYAAGDTGSTVTVASGGAHQTSYGGGVDDAILVKFDANGQRLWSTYNGGALHDIASGVTVDTNGDVVITGHTESSTAMATAGTYGTTYSLNYDVFISKFNSSGVRQWGTYYGDTGADEAYAITTDASNNIYVAGFTTSVFGIATGSAFQPFIGGSNDVFLAKFDPSGANLIWGTYYGGAGDEKATALKNDFTTGNVYMVANTTSTSNIASVGAYQTTIGSADDACIVAFSSAGNRLWGTYYGGNDVDYINSMVLDANKNILVGGQTMSSNAISSAGAYQPTIGASNLYDAFFAKFGNNGQRKLGTYFGGPDNDMANGITVDSNNKVYLSGETTSTVSISTPGSHMQNYAGSTDAFLAKFCVAPEPTLTPAGSFTTCINTNYTITASTGYSAYLWNTGSSTNPLSVTGGSVAGTFYYAITVTDSDGCNGTSDSSSYVVNLCTGINEWAEQTEWKIYPNPASDQLNVSFKSNEKLNEIEVVSVLGEVVLRLPVTVDEISISIKNISSGVYFVRCKTNEKEFIKRIVIE